MTMENICLVHYTAKSYTIAEHGVNQHCISVATKSASAAKHRNARTETDPTAAASAAWYDTTLLK